VAKYIDTRGMRILDVGAGGGLFLNLMRSRGANVFGIEPSSTRIKFAQQRYGLELSAYTVEHPYWQEGYRDYFDVVTIWDVIEHVNSPVDLLQNAGNLLRRDGFLFIDTPARDAFYYRVGQLTYFLTAGRWPSFLNLMYSNERYGHKQILSSHQLIRIVTDRCFQVIRLQKFHELSLPYSSYLGKIFKSQTMARAVEPLVAFFFFLARIKNKMLLVARKKM
jgi:2-polyprenyl-6-hydroxyphenyl methylase/3-demethylubiquinone-9 3-methyltransferase